MKKENFFIDPDIRKAETLPPEAFTSKEFLELEIEHIFKKSWLWVPEEMPQIPGERVPFEILGQKIFMTRDQAGALRAFPNACTHKWNQLVAKKEAGEKIICSYHGRQFGLDGKFLFQPRCENPENFPRKCDSLKEYCLENWFNVSFINLSEPAISFGNIFYPIGVSLSALLLEKMQLSLFYKMPIDGNWKYHIDNYIDELHLKFVHGGKGGLCYETEIDSYETKIFENASLRWVYAKNPNDGFRHPDFPKPLLALWWQMFPNLTINVWKGGISINAYEPNLEDPNKTWLSVCHYAWDKKEFERIRKKWEHMNVDNEDLKVVAGVQQVIKHTSAPRGRFTPNGEKACHWFQRKIYEAVFVKKIN